MISDVDTTYKTSRRSLRDASPRTSPTIADAGDGNFLALFPSYAFLREISERMPAIREARHGPAQRHDRLRAQRDPGHPARAPRKGNLILAVSGGMYAEGIDYQGDMLSGVMVIGPALPQVSFEQELLKAVLRRAVRLGIRVRVPHPRHDARRAVGRPRDPQRDGHRHHRAALQALHAGDATRATSRADWYEESPRELVSQSPPARSARSSKRRAPPQLRIV